jgi:hypothetical protein
MAFEFVNNNTSLGRDVRKKIRSHVAMGRNVGKTYARPSRKAAFVISTKTAAPKAVKKRPQLESSREVDIFFEIERQIGDGLSVLCLPAPLTPGSSSLVRKGMSSTP